MDASLEVRSLDLTQLDAQEHADLVREITELQKSFSESFRTYALLAGARRHVLMNAHPQRREEALERGREQMRAQGIETFDETLMLVAFPEKPDMRDKPWGPDIHRVGEFGDAIAGVLIPMWALPVVAGSVAKRTSETWCVVAYPCPSRQIATFALGLLNAGPISDVATAVQVASAAHE